MVRTKGAHGATVERVRVYLDPPTAYQTWNREASVLQVEAGEIQHYVTRAEADAVGLDQAGDWWLIDGEILIEYRFDGIESVGVDVVTDPGRVAAAERWWQVATELVQVAAA
jgi:hypothetical protein